MGRKKTAPGPLTLVQPAATAPELQVHAPNNAHSRSQALSKSPSQSQLQLQSHSPWPHSQAQLQPHSAGPVPTRFLGETQGLSPEVARSSTSTSTSTGISTAASPSLSSASTKSPRSIYTSRFSPRNLTPNQNSSLSPASSSSSHLPQSRPQTAALPPQPIPRKAARAVLHPPETVPKGTIPRQQRPQPTPAPTPTPTPIPNSASAASASQRHPQRTPIILHSTSLDSLSSFDAKKHPHIAELHQRFPPITKAATTSSHQQAKQHHQAERRLKSSHGRRHGDEQSAPVAPSSPSNHHLRSLSHTQNIQSFLFNFSNKLAKSGDRQPPEPLQPRAQFSHAAMNVTEQPAITKQTSTQSDTAHAPAPSLPSNCETSLGDGDPSSTPASTKKASKPKPFTLLSRTKSQRDKGGRSPGHTPSPQHTKDAAPALSPTRTAARVPIMELNPPDRAPAVSTPRTATMPPEPAYREAMSATARNHSADRASSRDASSDRRGHQDRDHQSRSHQSTSRDGNGASSFFNNLRREGGRVAETIGKGLFGKGGRSASTTERDPVDDEHYVLKVINLPLVEQTRLTRISKRLEESRDKTEFWMPAFPWRAIDYLNYKGCDVEGLYRVPGSGPQIKKWQRRFDEQHDVDLFTQEDLYDINIIGSMLKAWLRELPDELFPKEAQDRIARECAGSEKVPQMLIDELSSLSPFNYYLLFAITCHLSLLLAHSDKNKMDFRNLCICFQPCMKIDAFCFKFLVCDWRDCWKGCRTEARFIEEEYKLFDQPPPPGLGIKKRLEPRGDGQPNRRPSPAPERDERDLSSADSNSKKSQHSGDQMRLKKKSPPPRENGRENGTSVPRSVHTEMEAQGSPRGSNDMRPLSPIKPLSPLGF